ncbi:MAG: tRNA (N(6)-L-threonylcarbamoyladenosine(37)-C(2))-methylthiotransferase MtaB [Lachnospiraceae bacterium]|nr:tRNA (N(6)-L-threonylcarbamoyladenosine(37)-C(2))-methylthiotransferase MtaB [Lachnospiraceae bacterium]
MGTESAGKASLHNLGCKVNAYEMDVMEQILRSKGYEIVPFGEKADVCIINTCTVTNIADRKSRQMLHRARSENPGAVIVAVGCYVQTGLEEALKDEGIDLCIGNNNKSRIAEILERYLDEREAGRTDKMPGGDTVSSMKDCPYERMELTELSSRTRAYIKIQDGCDQFCTYCIIPFARGRVRCREREDIVKEVAGLAGKGISEFVLTGINVSTYGADGLLGLLNDLDGVKGVRRIRLSSLEPRLFTEGFVRGLKAVENLCPHFHLSLQSGSDSVLKRMNRHYDTKEYAEKAELLRSVFDDPAITTDIIAGFPGETEEEFEETFSFARKTGFYEMHVFKYSRREGTVADRMSGQLTDREKSARSEKLISLGRLMSEEYVKRHEGLVREVLFEEVKELDGREYVVGHTPEYIHVAAEGGTELCGRIESVKLKGNAGEGFIKGELIKFT